VTADLIRGDYDKPIVCEGEDAPLLSQLETLRVALRDARTQTEEETRRKDVVVASVAHDLKTPLAVISGYAECISDGMNDKNYASLIMEKAEKMNEQVISLVESTRKQSAESSGQREVVKSRKFFKAEAQKYIPLAKAKSIKYKIGNSPDYPLHICPAEISRMLQNLVSNAIKYTPSGGKIRISFIETRSYLRIKIKDSGIGIEKTDLPHIFEKFYMADKSRGDQNSSGLGLFIVKQIIEDHGGKIYVKSRKNRGSAFYVFLPIVTKSNYGTARFDAFPKFKKFFIILFSAFLFSSFYRFGKYLETRQKSTLAAAIIFLPMFIFGWFADLINVLIDNRISLLSD
jgi:signal transduction histidine kinase